MPMSRPDTIIPVLQTITRKRPLSILDVGCGDGFYGVLLRRALDGDVSIGKGLHKRSAWKVRIDAVELWTDYLTPIHKYVYDAVYEKNIQTLETKRRYDVVLLGDIIEHFDKAGGFQLVQKCSELLAPNGIMVIVTPNYKCQFGESPNDNPHEEHKSLFTVQDFESLKGFKNKQITIHGKKIMVVLTI